MLKILLIFDVYQIHEGQEGVPIQTSLVRVAQEMIASEAGCRSEERRERHKDTDRACTDDQQPQTCRLHGIMRLGNCDGAGTASFLHDLNPKAMSMAFRRMRRGACLPSPQEFAGIVAGLLTRINKS
jgi:hypothetical protein